MVADANLQVWLDTQANVGQTLLVPYVKSVTERQISFRLDVIQRGGSGTSRVSQHGLVNAAAEAPTSLGRVALGVQQNAQCSIELQLKEGDQDLGAYHFECPR